MVGNNSSGLTALDADMRVQAGGSDGAMAQQRLQYNQIHARVKKMRGKAVTQGVGRAGLGQPGIQSRLA